MTTQLVFKNRRMRVCVWNATPGFVSAASAALDQQIRHIVQVEMVPLKKLEDSSASPCDLLIIAAEGLDEAHVLSWLQAVSARVPKAHGIPVPSIIFSAVTAATQRDMLRWAVDGNWYFDIVDPDHVASLPVRVANFLRLHDHLHEIRRMGELVRQLETKMQDMEQNMSSQMEILMKGQQKS
jgi:hypothetical protein